GRRPAVDSKSDSDQRRPRRAGSRHLSHGDREQRNADQIARNHDVFQRRVSVHDQFPVYVQLGRVANLDTGAKKSAASLEREAAATRQGIGWQVGRCRGRACSARQLPAPPAFLIPSVTIPTFSTPAPFAASITST